MAIRARDDRTRDLFQVPAARSLPRTLDFRAEVSCVVAEMLAGATGTREQISDRISDLTGRRISKPMLDGYASPARDTFNLPLAAAPALEVATHSTALIEWFASVRGGRLLFGRDGLAADLARLERQRFDAARKIRAIRKQIGAGK